MRTRIVVVLRCACTRQGNIVVALPTFSDGWYMDVGHFCMKPEAVDTVLCHVDGELNLVGATSSIRIPEGMFLQISPPSQSLATEGTKVSMRPPT